MPYQYPPGPNRPGYRSPANKPAQPPNAIAEWLKRQAEAFRAKYPSWGQTHVTPGPGGGHGVPPPSAGTRPGQPRRATYQPPGWLSGAKAAMDYWGQTKVSAGPGGGHGLPPAAVTGQSLSDAWGAAYTGSAATHKRPVYLYNPAQQAALNTQAQLTAAAAGAAGIPHDPMSDYYFRHKTLKRVYKAYPEALPPPTGGAAPYGGGYYGGYASSYGYGGGGGRSSGGYSTPTYYSPRQQNYARPYQQMPNVSRWVNELVNWRISG